MYFEFYLPAGVWGLIFVLMLIMAGHCGLYLFDFWCKKKKVPHNNEVAGIIFGVLSLIYSLLIAFVIVAVWANYENLNRTIEREADNVNTVLIHSNMLPDSLKNTVETAIKEYCRKVVQEEWESPEGKVRFRQSAIPNLRQLLFRAETGSKAQESLLNLLDDRLSDITNLRRERLSHTRSYVPQLVWMILIISSIMIIVFSYFLHMESQHLKRIFLSFLWALIAMSLFLVYMLDHPFIGSTQVSKEPFEEIISTLDSV